MQWFKGDVSPRRMSHLYAVARAARRIYVRGEEKVSYLENPIERSIINHENYNSPSFNKLESLFPNSSVCMTDLRKHVENKNNFCALFKARLIKSWLYTILPEDWRDSNEEIHSELFYAALVNHRRAQGTQNFQFGTLAAAM